MTRIERKNRCNLAPRYTRSLALGVIDSISFATGCYPTPYNPKARMLATVGSFLLLLFLTGCGVVLSIKGVR